MSGNRLLPSASMIQRSLHELLPADRPTTICVPSGDQEGRSSHA
jgi:hypothetical protein